MNKGIIALIIVVAVALGGLFFYNVTHVNVKAGYVGYMYDRTINVGDPRAIAGTSVIDEPLTGRVSINPITQELYKYPTTIVPRSWTAGTDEGADRDQAFRVGTQEGKNVVMDVYISVRPFDVGKIIASFGGKSFDAIVDDDLYGLTKGKLSIVTQDVSVYDVQTERSMIQSTTFDILAKALKETYGIELVRFEIGNLDLPDDIQAKIDQKTEAINAVELAKLDREKQDEINQKVVDEQQANSEKDLIERQMSADAEAYELEREAQAMVTVAQAEKDEAELRLEIAKLEKEAELEKQGGYTTDYFRNKELDAYIEAVDAVNSNLQIIITDGSDSGYGSIYGLNEIMGIINGQ